MVAVLAFGIVLLLAVLVSDLAHRSVLSTAVLFLVAGFVLGPGMAGVIALSPDHPVVTTFAELALFTVLFTDGMRTSIRDLAAAWSLPGRALLFGMPLTLLCTAAAAHWVVSIPWPESLLMGAVLSPTDPVFAAAIVGREEVPERLRRLLNVESGLNDGLALSTGRWADRVRRAWRISPLDRPRRSGAGRGHRCCRSLDRHPS